MLSACANVLLPYAYELAGTMVAFSENIENMSVLQVIVWKESNGTWGRLYEFCEHKSSGESMTCSINPLTVFHAWSSTHSLTHSPSHTQTHKLLRTLTHSLSLHTLTHKLTISYTLTHSLSPYTHSHTNTLTLTLSHSQSTVSSGHLMSGD